jgi:EPS-associated MarR family transcriptional regulator
MTDNPQQILRDEVHLRVLRLLEQNPNLSQRELADMLGVSLGKANYCIAALLEKGWIKMHNFHHQPDKRVYTYLLTPEGVAEKAGLTLRFLVRKRREYDLLRVEIEELAREVEMMTTNEESV